MTLYNIRLGQCRFGQYIYSCHHIIETTKTPHDLYIYIYASKIALTTRACRWRKTIYLLWELVKLTPPLATCDVTPMCVQSPKVLWRNHPTLKKKMDCEMNKVSQVSVKLPSHSIQSPKTQLIIIIITWLGGHDKSATSFVYENERPHTCTINQRCA